MFKKKNFNKQERLKMRIEHFLAFVLFRKLPKIVKRGTKSELLSIYREYYPITIHEESCPSQKMMAEIITYAIKEELYRREITSDEFVTVTTSEASIFTTLSRIQENAKNEVK